MLTLLSNRHYLLLIDALLLILCIGYITLGIDDVPFHGDESTTIWMSRDYDTVILKGDFDAVAYETPSRRSTDQHMRIITTNISKLAMGAAWSSINLNVEDVNDQWVWGLDMQWNRDNGHIPSDKLLRVSRLTSAWMTAIGTVFIMAIGRIIGRTILSQPLAIAGSSWGATILYTLHPAILVNGRRAMFEGSLLLGLTALAWATFMLIKHQQTKWYIYALFGILTGITLSTKHNATFTVVLLYGGLGITMLWKWWQHRQQYQLFLPIGKIALATLIALLVFLALNPLWWSQPFKMPPIVIDERQQILDAQVATFGGYENFTDRLSGLWEQSFRVSPQYFEAAYWADYDGVQEEISTYEDHYLAGWTDDIIIFAGRLLFAMLGISAVINVIRHGTLQAYQMIFVWGIWCIGIIGITFITVPIDWQRYYLQIQPPLILLMGLGIGKFIDLWLHNQRSELLA